MIRVSALSTFVMRWPIPRLDRFPQARPETEVTVATTTMLNDTLRGGFDLAIRRGAEPWPQFRAGPFLNETDTLVASPVLLTNTPLGSPTDLSRHVLLAIETRPNDWSDWLAAAGTPRVNGTCRRVFDRFFATLQAVEDGLGLGIGPFPVFDAALGAGRLVAPFPEIGVVRTGYVALTPYDADKTPSLGAFVDWLVAEGKGEGKGEGEGATARR